MEQYNIARMMSNLFDTLILWQSGWNRPLKHLDVLYVPGVTVSAPLSSHLHPF